jgi:hypothetical protein
MAAETGSHATGQSLSGGRLDDDSTRISALIRNDLTTGADVMRHDVRG